MSEFFQNGHNGILVSQGDFEQVAMGLRKLQQNPELSRSLGRNARAEAELCYSSGIAWQSFEELINPRPCSDFAFNVVQQPSA